MAFRKREVNARRLVMTTAPLPMITLAHLSDVHLGPMPKGSFASYFAAGNRKRLLGRLSWWVNRRHIHLRRVADALREDVRKQAPDHVAITGDLVNISLDGEFATALDWLKAFGPADWISVVPGNHDAYVPQPFDQTIGLWNNYMSDERAGHNQSGADQFPFVRRRGPVAVIGLSSAVATAPGFATGHLGKAQLERLDRCLGALAEEPTPPFRVVLIHHPPLTGQNRDRKKLLDAGDLEHVLRRHGAELMLHGHNHRDIIEWYHGGPSPVPVIGVASASAAKVFHGKPCAQYNLYAISSGSDAWTCRVTVRGLVPDTLNFETINEFDLKPKTPD